MTQGHLTQIKFCMAIDAGAFDAFQLLHGIWRTFCAWHLTQIEIDGIWRTFCVWHLTQIEIDVIWRTFFAWHLTQINFTCQLTQIYVHGNWRRIFFFQNFFKFFFWRFFSNFFQIFFSNFLFKFFFNFFFFLATVKLSNSLQCKYLLCLKSFWKLTFWKLTFFNIF